MHNSSNANARHLSIVTLLKSLTIIHHSQHVHKQLRCRNNITENTYLEDEAVPQLAMLLQCSTQP